MAEKLSADKITYTHPLFMNPGDIPGMILILVKLTGSENYGMWSKSMQIALMAKRKLGFVTGTCKRESFEAELHEQWDTCNATVLSWIMNTISVDLLSGIVYASDSYADW
ncbi:uncharacterized protein LOC142175175 [Nicotiana tabacum]|uniref:Uncharacterized protein LOC142175175 n=1 Tax=Nicotiana tabacum TaxID=4097 RepID=A0AC58TKY0_TOBAC